MEPVRNLDAFYLTFDEPLKNERWLDIKMRYPHIQRVDGIKGFDRAHKVCAQKSQTERLIIIDGDNQILKAFEQEKLPRDFAPAHSVISWSSLNSINGLSYGNGGIKCWDRSTLLNLKSHEEADTPEAITDFCFSVPYYQVSHALSVTQVHLTPKQAFRSGFREGIKMSLDRGVKLDPKHLRTELFTRVHRGNLWRLRVWMSLGADVANGMWAILGARLGFVEFYKNDLPLSVVMDYEGFEKYWSEEIAPQFLGREERCAVSQYSWSKALVGGAISEYGRQIQELSGLVVEFCAPERSAWLKTFQLNFERRGLL